MQEKLEENWKLGAVAAIAAGVILGMHQHKDDGFNKSPDLIREHPARVEARNDVDHLSKVAMSKYKIKPELAVHIATMAKKHEHPVFPKAKDLMAVIGIESSFNPNAKSRLKISPARGLTQIRPEIWGLDHKKDLATPEQQIAKSSEILASYHKRLGGDDDAAVHSYNVGVTNYKRGTGLNPKYVDKFKNERALYD